MTTIRSRSPPAVDLEHVEREGGQIGKAGVSGAKIVDGNADAFGTQAREALGDGGLIDQQRALGDLDDDSFGFDARCLDFAEQPLVESFARKILGQEVERDLQPF